MKQKKKKMTRKKQKAKVAARKPKAASRPSKPKRKPGKPVKSAQRKKSRRGVISVEIATASYAVAQTPTTPGGVAATAYLPGVDMRAVSTPQVNCIASAGKKFVARYYARGASSKILRRPEALAISQAGMKIVSVWEDGFPDKVGYFSRAKGVADGAEAHARANEIKQPHNTAIYFAVDYDAEPADIAGPISEYFRGVAEGLRNAGMGVAWYDVGVYGSGITCDAILGAGLAKYSWLAQSTGWRGYYTFMVWNIKQYGQTKLCTLDVDPDDAKPGYGEFAVT